NNGGGLTALHGFPSGSRFALQDMTGRIIVEGSTTIEGRTGLQGLDLARGAYLFRLLNGDRTESTKFVY
ncbi:MAG: T9SS type A sorting domain-containing protein, partial [Flavobacteriales bacterium]|nr:T9SS type A sorting domain-containing protein [Flavobacteriales bacterium]